MNTDSIIRLCNDNRSNMYSYSTKTSNGIYDNTDFFFNPNFYDRHFISGPDAIEKCIEAIDKLLKK
jgi:hypothetical protein